jgi:FkbM family methyltransferase
MLKLINRFSKWRKKKRSINQIKKWSIQDKKRLSFYKNLIPENALVFDIGANLGNRTKVFSKFCSKVIAVEPQSYCFNILSEVFSQDSNVTLVNFAIGNEQSKGEMYISKEHTISSMSKDWLRKVSESKRFRDEWHETITVNTKTLDYLISTYGVPDFIKIDVEGYELNIIKGLNMSVDLLSFEYTLPEMVDDAIHIIKRLESMSNHIYQLVKGEDHEFYFNEWISRAELESFLLDNKCLDFGDIYAKKL